jgi:hypothetical protein
MRAILLASLALSGCATMTPAERASEMAYQSLHAIDTLQTLDIRRAGKVETNPILGPAPSDRAVIGYMAAEAALHLIVSDQLARHDAPAWVRAAWHVTSVSMASNTISNNARIGLKVRF